MLGSDVSNLLQEENMTIIVVFADHRRQQPSYETMKSYRENSILVIVYLFGLIKILKIRCKFN